MASLILSADYIAPGWTRSRSSPHFHSHQSFSHWCRWKLLLIPVTWLFKPTFSAVPSNTHPPATLTWGTKQMTNLLLHSSSKSLIAHCTDILCLISAPVPPVMHTLHITALALGQAGQLTATRRPEMKQGSETKQPTWGRTARGQRDATNTAHGWKQRTC